MHPPRLLPLLLFLLAASCTPATSTTATKPTTRPTQIISTDLAGHPLDPFAATPTRKATLLLFITDTCPISNGYAPDIRRLAETYAPQGIAFYLVYADPDLSQADAQKHYQDYAYPCPALLDPKRDLVRRAGATVTPEAAVFLPSGERVYLGRIDDRAVAYAKSRTTVTTHDLQDVLESLVHDRPVTPHTTKAVGCPIPD
jgi:hypothetical protein